MLLPSSFVFLAHQLVDAHFQISSPLPPTLPFHPPSHKQLHTVYASHQVCYKASVAIQSSGVMAAGRKPRRIIHEGDSDDSYAQDEAAKSPPKQHLEGAEENDADGDSFHLVSSDPGSEYDPAGEFRRNGRGGRKLGKRSRKDAAGSDDELQPPPKKKEIVFGSRKRLPNGHEPADTNNALPSGLGVPSFLMSTRRDRTSLPNKAAATTTQEAPPFLPRRFSLQQSKSAATTTKNAASKAEKDEIAKLKKKVQDLADVNLKTKRELRKAKPTMQERGKKIDELEKEIKELKKEVKKLEGLRDNFVDVGTKEAMKSAKAEAELEVSGMKRIKTATTLKKTEEILEEREKECAQLEEKLNGLEEGGLEECDEIEGR